MCVTHRTSPPRCPLPPQCALGADHPGLPPNNDGNMSWSLGDREYVNGGSKRGCTSDYFQGGNSVTCPDNSQWNTSNFSDYVNLLGMLDDLRYASAKQKATGQPFFLVRTYLPISFQTEVS